MEPFFLNLSPADPNRMTMARFYLFMAVVFFLVGGYGIYREYMQGGTAVTDYFLSLLQLALATSYLYIAWRRRKPSGSRYVQVTEDHLELKLSAQAALTLPWATISLLRVQQDKLLYRLISGQTGEVAFDTLPGEHEHTVREAIRQAGQQKGVSL